MNTLEQELANQVYNKILGRKGSSDAKTYGSMAHSLPILVRTAGLTQALAFVDSRNKPALDGLLEDLAQVVANCNREELLAQSRTAELQLYIYLTRKTMLALKWFKRFAESVLDVQVTDEG